MKKLIATLFALTLCRRRLRRRSPRPHWFGSGRQARRDREGFGQEGEGQVKAKAAKKAAPKADASAAK